MVTGILTLSALWFLKSYQAWSGKMFSKASDFLLGREHRFVRDYLFLSGGLLVAATATGMYLSNQQFAVDPMPVASINNRTEVDSRIYSVVRSVLSDGQAVRVAIDPSTRSPANADDVTTGSIGDELRKVTIDPCTGETKR
jgi:hypothetical protein